MLSLPFEWSMWDGTTRVHVQRSVIGKCQAGRRLAMHAGHVKALRWRIEAMPRRELFQTSDLLRMTSLLPGVLPCRQPPSKHHVSPIRSGRISVFSLLLYPSDTIEIHSETESTDFQRRRALVWKDTIQTTNLLALRNLFIRPSD